MKKYNNKTGKTIETNIVFRGKHPDDRRINTYDVCYWITDENNNLIDEDIISICGLKSARKFEKDLLDIL